MKSLISFLPMVLVFLLLCSCNSESENSKEPETTTMVESDSFCPETAFESPQAQADAIVEAFNKASDSTIIDKAKWEKALFCAFPNSFLGMEAVFGYDSDLEENSASPLYSGGGKYIEYFGNLKSIPTDIYYEKYININVNGTWEADNIHSAFGIENRLEKDTKNACIALDKRTDAEIKSIFRFIYDGPHPDHPINQENFEKLHPIVAAENERLGTLFKSAYDKLLAEDDGHGH